MYFIHYPKGINIRKNDILNLISRIFSNTAILISRRISLWPSAELNGIIIFFFKVQGRIDKLTEDNNTLKEEITQYQSNSALNSLNDNFDTRFKDVDQISARATVPYLILLSSKVLLTVKCRLFNRIEKEN